MEKGSENIPKLNSKKNNLKDLTRSAILTILLLAWNQAEGKVLTGTTSQKQAIEQLIQEWKLLPNVPTDYGHYGRNYLSGDFAYNIAPYWDHWQRYKADNLADIDGKDMTIQNDIDSCNFLNETIYKSNLDKIVPIIIDTQIDTLSAARWEYERVDRENSRSFIGWTPNKESLTVENAWANTHMNAVANVIVAKKNNFTEEDYDKWLDWRRWREDVWVYPGKTRLYVQSPAVWWLAETKRALDNIYNEAKIHPDKKYILSYSYGWTSDSTNDWFTKLGTLDNVIMIVPRSDPSFGDNAMTYAAHPATIEVWFVKMPSISMESWTQRISFAWEEKDRIVPNPGTWQTGKMRGDGFSVLGEWSTSEATAFMTGIVSNIRAQNPDRTKDEVIAMLKRDVYKSSEYAYDENWWNEWIGYGVVQPWKTMKENIFPEFKEVKNKSDGKYYFSISNFPSEYSIIGEWVSKDQDWYYIDLTTINPWKYVYTFVWKCNYEGKDYDFPISRTLEVVDTLTSINHTKVLSGVEIYPNPVVDILNFNIWSDVWDLNVKIYNTVGQLYTSPKVSSENSTIDLSRLSPWIYFVTMEDDKWNKKTEKIVKL